MHISWFVWKHFCHLSCTI